MTTKEKAAGLVTRAASQTNPNPHHSPAILAAQRVPAHGKAAAVAAYNWGVLSLQSCARLFARNPQWRGA